MKSAEIVKAVVQSYFDPRVWAVCPNVSWGAGLGWEADIYAVGVTGVVHEIEVKVSKHDLERDRQKRKWAMTTHLLNHGAHVDCFWLAVPETLKDWAMTRAKELKCGLFVCREVPARLNPGPTIVIADRVLKPKRVRKVKMRENVEAKKQQIHRLCALRYWRQFLKG